MVHSFCVLIIFVFLSTFFGYKKNILFLTFMDLTFTDYWGFPGGASGKESACQCRRCKRPGFEPWVRKIPWRKKTATHSSILAWKIPWTEKLGGLQSTELERVEHNWVRTHTHTDYLPYSKHTVFADSFFADSELFFKVSLYYQKSKKWHMFVRR